MIDFCEKDLETPRKIKIFWTIYQKLMKNKDDKIKMLQQSNCTLKTKINSLNIYNNNLIHNLKNKLI